MSEHGPGEGHVLFCCASWRFMSYLGCVSVLVDPGQEMWLRLAHLGRAQESS